MRRYAAEVDSSSIAKSPSRPEDTADAAGFVTTTVTNWLPVLMLPADPGIFTFGGLGQGQAAVLNYDATAGYSINSAKNQAAKGSTISLYATGMGDLMRGVLVTVTDKSSTPLTASADFGLTVNPSRATPATAPTVDLAFKGGALPAGVQNSLYAYTLLATAGTGTPPYVWSVTGLLPPGMSINGAGLLTGMPGAAGHYSPTFTLIDNSSPKQSASATLSLTISPQGITITTGTVPDGVKDLPYTTTTLVATGGTAPYTWSLAPLSALPAGLSLIAGQLTGAPTALPNKYTFSIMVQDSASPKASQTQLCTMTVNPAMAITTPTLPDGLVGVAYTATLGVQGGNGNLTWSVAAGAWPTGLTMDSKGVVSGTPTVAVTNGLVKVTVNDSSTPTLSATYNVSIDIAAALQITMSLPPILFQYEALPAQILRAAGGTPPYIWTAAGLPPGLVLDRNTGVLSGVPLTQVALPLRDGAVSLGAVYLDDNTYRVSIDGQPAVTSYAGASQGSVAGLVQINAVVPPTARTGPSIPLTVSIGSADYARRSQPGVTIAVK